MAEQRHVQIPLSLFTNIIGFFEYLVISNYEFPALFRCDDILAELRGKQHKINLHTAYTLASHAKDDGQRRRAIVKYLDLKNRI